ncbi:MAG: phospholipase D-like domain-containing protein, partial [Saprospiraceae bacterium]
PKVAVPKSKISVSKFISALQNYNMRMHDKLIICDGIAFIAGGRNIENSYFGLDDRNFYDRDLYFYSKSLTENVRKYFLQLWDSKYVADITYTYKSTGKRAYKKSENKVLGDKLLDEYYNKYLLDINTDFLPLIKGLYFNKASFLSSYDSENDNFNPEYLSTSLLNLIFKVKRELIIETPYLLPTDNLYKLLNYLSLNDVQIEFITNSICSTDVMPIAAAYDNQKMKLNSLNIALFEYLGPDYLHVKSAVIDDRMALIGSYNMDPRSANINTELVFIIDDPYVAAELKSIIEDDKNKCIKVEENEQNTYGGYYGCWKNEKDMMTYLFFKVMTGYKLLYNQF